LPGRISPIYAFALACLISLPSFLVACTSSENDDYANEVMAVNDSLREDMERLDQPHASPNELIRYYRQAANNFHSAATSLSEVSAPEEVADLHDKLISEVQALADVVTGAADEIKQGGAAATPGAVSQVATEATKIQAQFSSTIDEINSKLQD
jgi:hypothetical protein